MKKNILILALIFSFLGVKAQDLAGRKILHSSVKIGHNKNEYTKNSNYDLSILYGKIKENNTYLAFGGVFGGQHNEVFSNSTQNIKTKSFEIGPSIEFGKFVPLIDKLYISPNAGGSVRGVFGDAQGVALTAYASPLRFMYHFTQHFMLTASLGSASLYFKKVEETTNFNLTGSLTNNTNFGIFYSFK